MLKELLTTPSVSRPLIITLLGSGGIGKTTLSSNFPSPVFIRVEDGSMVLRGREDVAMLPVIRTTKDIFQQIELLATEEHTFKTLVIDSITQLNVLIESEILASDPKAKSINSALGGYGAGHSATSEIHRKIRDWCGMLSTDRNMNIIFIGHMDTETIELPDSDMFMRYTLRMNKKSISHYSDNVDVVGHIKLKTFTRGGTDDKVAKAISDGTRVLTTYATANSISKNRLGITEDIILDEKNNPFSIYF